VAFALVGSGLCLPSPGPGAAADDPATVAVGVEAVATPVLSGDFMTWRVDWSCSSTVTPCLGATLTFVLPRSVPDDLPLNLNTLSATPAGSLAPAPSFVAGTLVWTFVASLPAGNSGSVTVSARSVNFTTPDGSTFTPTATMAASNATAATATQAPITVSSSPDLQITKRRAGDPERVPLLPGPVTYIMYASNPVGERRQDGTFLGRAELQDITITDTLPVGAELVEANPTPSSVSGDAASGYVVTWSIDTLALGLGVTVQVTVQYDSPPFAGTDEVTNSVRVRGKPWLRPAADDVEATASTTHGFRTEADPPDLAILKTGSYENSGTLSVRGQNGQYVVGLTNGGDLESSFEFDDVLPCPFVASATPCADPGIAMKQINLGGNYGLTPSHPVTVTWFATDASTGTFTVDGLWDAGVAIPVPDGTTVNRLHVSGRLGAGEQLIVFMTGRNSELLPQAYPDPVPAFEEPLVLPTGRVQMENCFTNLVLTYAPVLGEPEATHEPDLPASQRCGQLIFDLDRTSWYVNKGVSPSLLSPGATATVTLSIANVSSPTYQTMLPVLTDLLPAEMSFVSGSARASAPFDGVITTTVDDFAGTGRTLVRFTWPDDVELVSGDGFALSFEVEVATTHPAGNFTNQVRGFDRSSPEWPITAQQCVGISSTFEALDTEDRSGDGRVGDHGCGWEVPYTVAAGPAIAVRKFVKGPNDADFVEPPAAGILQPGQDGQFRLDVTNTGNVPITSVVLYDLLPAIGDTGTLLVNQSRGTQFRPGLSEVTAPPGGTVQYSVAAVPCRGDLITGGSIDSAPSGCTDDWSSSAPADLATVTALRVSFGDEVFAVSETRSLLLRVTTPITGDGVAWNSAAVFGVSAGPDASPILPTESQKVGLRIPADVELTKDLETAGPHFPLAEATYLLRVTNRGPSTARALVVTDRLPAGMAVISSAPSQGTFDSVSLAWSVGDLAVDATATLRLVTRLPDTVMPVNNWAEVTGLDDFDVDSSPSNCADLTVREDDCDDAPLTMSPRPAIDIVKTTNGVDAPVPTGPIIPLGNTVLWAYTVTNTGQDVLVDVVVTDNRVDPLRIDCGGGSNRIAELAVGSVAVCQATGVAAVGQYANTGTVVGVGRVSGVSVTDSYDSHYLTDRLPETGSSQGPLVPLGVALLAVGLALRLIPATRPGAQANARARN
jgi:uncharacterized repeat protein (TIGR01451 family)